MRFIVLTIFLLTSLTGCGGSTIEWFPDTSPTSQISINTLTLADAPTNFAYSQSLAASGGTGTYTWTVASGTLPAGLTLSAAGTLSGTPTPVSDTTAGTGLYTFTVKASDTASSPLTATRSLSIFTPTTGRMYDPALKVYGEGLSFGVNQDWTVPLTNTDTIPHTIQVVVANYTASGVATGSIFNMTPVTVAAGATVTATNSTFENFPVNNWRMKSISIQ